MVLPGPNFTCLDQASPVCSLIKALRSKTLFVSWILGGLVRFTLGWDGSHFLRCRVRPDWVLLSFPHFGHWRVILFSFVMSLDLWVRMICPVLVSFILAVWPSISISSYIFSVGAFLGPSSAIFFMGISITI